MLGLISWIPWRSRPLFFEAPVWLCYSNLCPFCCEISGLLKNLATVSVTGRLIASERLTGAQSFTLDNLLRYNGLNPRHFTKFGLKAIPFIFCTQCHFVNKCSLFFWFQRWTCLFYILHNFLCCSSVGIYSKLRQCFFFLGLAVLINPSTTTANFLADLGIFCLTLQTAFLFASFVGNTSDSFLLAARAFNFLVATLFFCFAFYLSL